MKELWKKALEVKTEIERERGEVDLFALLDHGKVPGKWDLVIAAPWASQGLRVGIEYVLAKIDVKFGKQERSAIAAVILLRPTEEFVRNVRAEIGETDGPIELRNCVLNGMDIVHAYLILSPKKSASTPPAAPAVT